MIMVTPRPERRASSDAPTLTSSALWSELGAGDTNRSKRARNHLHIVAGRARAAPQRQHAGVQLRLAIIVQCRINIFHLIRIRVAVVVLVKVQAAWKVKRAGMNQRLLKEVRFRVVQWPAAPCGNVLGHVPVQ